MLLCACVQEAKDQVETSENTQKQSKKRKVLKHRVMSCLITYNANYIQVPASPHPATAAAKHAKKTSNRKTNAHTLYLNLKAEHFDDIMNLEKFEEYRDRIKYYYGRIEESAWAYTQVWFMNGMQKDAREMLVEFKGLVVERKRYVIKLGKIISTDKKQIHKLVQ